MSKLRQLKMILESLMLETDDKAVINDVIRKSAWEIFKSAWNEFWWDWRNFNN
jgi:hypothetical protein